MLKAKGIIIEGDCKNVLYVCRNSLRRANWNDATFIAQDLYFLAELNQLLIRHIPREANRLADFCAKYGSSCNFVWNDVIAAPPEFMEIVHDDFGYGAFFFLVFSPHFMMLMQLSWVDPAGENGEFEPEGRGDCSKRSFLGRFSSRAGGNGANAAEG
ncbi:hypothetical protein KSP40_PGU016732 [Platanthera guangdongensis]|uniref:RNase H type-1 domain-containing protein n=1 Tax=Platanthera guangdongensis TaxID=2320717 RepID=A0ABR2LRT4_9ASPA